LLLLSSVIFDCPCPSVSAKPRRRLDEIALPQKIWQETGLLKLRSERELEYLELPLDAWLKVLQNMSKPAPT
jgi:hypothetical protein